MNESKTNPRQQTEHINNAWEDAAAAFDRATDTGITDSEREAYWDAYTVARGDMFATSPATREAFKGEETKWASTH